MRKDLINYLPFLSDWSYSSRFKSNFTDVLVVLTVFLQLTHITLSIRVVISPICWNSRLSYSVTAIIPRRLRFWSFRFGNPLLPCLRWQQLRCHGCLLVNWWFLWRWFIWIRLKITHIYNKLTNRTYVIVIYRPIKIFFIYNFTCMIILMFAVWFLISSYQFVSLISIFIYKVVLSLGHRSLLRYLQMTS